MTLVLIGMVPPPAPTEAAWVVTAPTTSDRLIGRLPPPTISACALRRASVTGTPNGIVVSWRLPEGVTVSDVQIFGGTTGATLRGLTDFDLRNNTTLPNPNGLMTTTIPSTTLGPLLSLGSTSQFVFQVAKGTKDTNTYWTSSATVNVTSGVVALTGCSALPG